MRILVETGELLEPKTQQASAEIILDARQDLSPIISDMHRIDAIQIVASSYGDGSVFSQARLLRRHGFTGRICAKGPLIPDQLHMACGSGIDEIEPNPEILARHNAVAWRLAAGRYKSSYLSRLKNPGQRPDQETKHA